MFNILEEGKYDCVGTRRVTRKGEPKIRSFFARLFYKIMKKISNMDIVDGARDFRLMTRQMTVAILEMKEYNRFSKGIFTWVGFNTKWLEYENIERVAGKTKWNYRRLLNLSIDGITSFTTSPLRWAAIIGILTSLAGFIYMLVIIFKTLIYGADVSGYASMMVVILFLGGIQLIFLGLIGEYLGRAFYEVKGRPLYFIDEYNEEKETNEHLNK